ncbi:MAG: SUMF1/EgtB/PvdO family nonheme iron enzyme [Pirellulales bacterium]
MRPATICLALFLTALCTPPTLLAETFGTGANQFTIDFVTVGNPGNAADTTGTPNPAGSVPYVYRMGKYEISRDMVIKANSQGELGITLADMTAFGGNGTNRPAAGISWNEAVRFVNWLNTSQGFEPAYKVSSQPDDVGYSANTDILLWQTGDLGYNAANPFRNTLARYFLPSVDEWYKAAYYDPNANGGAGGYWFYPIGSDTTPTAVSGGTAPDAAVYKQLLAQGPADVNNAGSPSPYGVMGMGGNVWEWEETEVDLVNDNGASFRGLRGGSWTTGPFGLQASNRGGDAPSFEFNIIGFRVASLPVFVCGDFDKDLDVDSADLVDFLSAWTGEGGTGATPDRGDCDVDGDVDSADMLTFLSHWTGSAESGRVASVPEPAMGLLVSVAITGLLLAHRRRRA